MPMKLTCERHYSNSGFLNQDSNRRKENTELNIQIPAREKSVELNVCLEMRDGERQGSRVTRKLNPCVLTYAQDGKFYLPEYLR